MSSLITVFNYCKGTAYFNYVKKIAVKIKLINEIPPNAYPEPSTCAWIVLSSEIISVSQ